MNRFGKFAQEEMGDMARIRIEVTLIGDHPHASIVPSDKDGENWLVFGLARSLFSFWLTEPQICHFEPSEKSFLVSATEPKPS